MTWSINVNGSRIQTCISSTRPPTAVCLHSTTPNAIRNRCVSRTKTWRQEPNPRWARAKGSARNSATNPKRASSTLAQARVTQSSPLISTLLKEKSLLQQLRPLCRPNPRLACAKGLTRNNATKPKRASSTMAQARVIPSSTLMCRT